MKQQVEPWHGTAGGYTNHACRCRECRDAVRIDHLRYMRENNKAREQHRLREQL
jgi:hypothetical protein